MANEIINKEHSLEKLLDIRTKYLGEMTYLHQVLLFNKITSQLHKEKESIENNKALNGRVKAVINEMKNTLLEN